MKQDKNNEIDLLLRSLARDDRRGSPLHMGNLSAREDGALSDHLDADELSSFAEGMVPDPARARYITHLADCESCRVLVISLTQASGEAARSNTLEQTGAGFWHKVAALFSPPVLRYAVPALALTAVIAVSFIALRPERRLDLVAQKTPIDSAAPTTANEQQTESRLRQSNTEVPAGILSSADSPAAGSIGEKKTSQDARSSVAQAPTTTADADASAGSSTKDLAQSKQAYVTAESRPTFAPEPQAAPPPPKPALTAADKLGAIQKEEVSKREIQELPREQEKNQTRDEAARQGPSRSSATLRANRRADGLMTENEARAKSKKDSEDEGETRTVSGKRFRRQGSAWVDTAYDSSRGTTNVTRGSERFRALVADEPGIRTIAEKLDGVVVVVWNGRAYRIQ